MGKDKGVLVLDDDPAIDREGPIAMVVSVVFKPLDKESMELAVDSPPGAVFPVAVARELLEQEGASEHLVSIIKAQLEQEFIGIKELGEQDFLKEAIGKALERWR